MDKMSLALDLNTVTDLVVPVYTVLVLVVLYMFNKASASSNSKRMYTFEPVKEGADKRIYGIDDFNGAWKQDVCPDLERWLIAFRKNFAIRMVASTMFFRQRAILKFNEEGTVCNMVRDFGKDTNTFVFPEISVGDCQASAPEVKIKSDDGKGENTLRMWFDKETGSLHMTIREGPHADDPCENHMVRTISPRDPNTINGFWDCKWLKPGRDPATCTLNVTYCRVEDDVNN